MYVPRRWHLAAIWAGIALIFAIGFWGGGKPRCTCTDCDAVMTAKERIDLATQADADQRRQQVVQSLKNATITIITPNGQGSGFCRRMRDGSVWVWTVAHVAEHCRRVRIVVANTDESQSSVKRFIDYTPAIVRLVASENGKLVTSREWLADVVRLDTKMDLALLRVIQTKPNGIGCLDFADYVPSVTDSVYCAGTPRGRDCTINMGAISFVGRYFGGRLMDQANCGTQPGSSGGPVCDSVGRVLGLVQGGHGETLTGIIPSRVIRDWADERGVRFAYDGDEPAAMEEVRKEPVEWVAVEGH